MKGKNPQKQKASYNPQQLQFRPRQQLSKAQQMLSEVVGNGERTWGTGECLPELNGALTPRMFNPNESGTAQTFFSQSIPNANTTPRFSVLNFQKNIQQENPLFHRRVLR